jgi:acetate kinase
VAVLSHARPVSHAEPERILVVNAGSSSLKLRLLDGTNAVLADADLPAVDGLTDAQLAHAVQELTRECGGSVDAVGHRVVHGGTRFAGPVRINPQVRHDLAELSDLAPLHQPKSLAALDAVTTALPDVPAVACFDTAFHRTLPAAASTYPVPAQWREAYGVRRYGFHGLSHAYCAQRAPEVCGREQPRIVSCHLGAGASLAAIVEGRSVDTTMGFTPLDGLVMATRSGALDPGLVLWLEEHEHLAPHDLASALEHRSGLLALCGTSDMRQVEKRRLAGDAAARLAFDVFVHRLVAGIGAMAVASRGLDALVFTGGIGEHSPAVRAAACSALGHLGVEIDLARNEATHSDGEIGSGADRVHVLVLTAREDLQIVREVRQVLAQPAC